MKTVWITKYALTTGTFTAETENIDSDDGMVNVKEGNRCLLYFKGQWSPTKEGAMVQAQEMRDRKLVSLRKQIKKLEKLNF